MANENLPEGTVTVRKILTPEGYISRHKQAFRAAFDYLNAHFPPSGDPAWWRTAAIDASLMHDGAKDNPLLAELLGGVINYLEQETRIRET